MTTENLNWKEKWGKSDAVRYLYRETSKRSGGGLSTLSMMADACQCLVKYGATFHDYINLRFYLRDAAARDTFLTTQMVKQEKAKWPKAAYDQIDNKGSFNELFSDFAGREWIDIDKADFDQFTEFIGRHPVFFIKPKRESSGIGIRKCDSSQFTEAQIREVYDNKGCLIEEVMIPHEKLLALNPNSVSFARVVTVVGTKSIHILAATLRTGGKANVSFNTAKDDCFSQIDIETGICMTDGVDEDGIEHKTHPVSGIPFKGFEMPHWNQVTEACLIAAGRAKDVRVIGWDVAILEDRVAFFEGNPGSGVASMQIADGIGKKQLFYSYLED